MKVWNLRNVRSAAGTWFIQAATYEKVTRSDGMPIWKLCEPLGDLEESNNDGIIAAGEAGIASKLERNAMARHGGIALEIGDFFDNESDEAAWRLGGKVDLRLYYAKATKKGERLIVCLARKHRLRAATATDRHGQMKTIVWNLVKRFGAVTPKQLKDLSRIGLEIKEAMWMPRLAGRPVDVG